MNANSKSAYRVWSRPKSGGLVEQESISVPSSQCTSVSMTDDEEDDEEGVDFEVEEQTAMKLKLLNVEG